MNQLVEEVLEHAGVKGMKWGVRKRKVPRQGPSGDAKDAHRALVKAKTSGVEALTNKELNALNQRLNLEQNYAKLSYNPSAMKKGLDTLNGLLKTGKTIDSAIEFSKTPTGQKMAASLGKKAATAAAKTAT